MSKGAHIMARPKSKSSSTRLQFECLEGRLMLAVFATFERTASDVDAQGSAYALAPGNSIAVYDPRSDSGDPTETVASISPEAHDTHGAEYANAELSLTAVSAFAGPSPPIVGTAYSGVGSEFNGDVLRNQPVDGGKGSVIGVGTSRGTYSLIAGEVPVDPIFHAVFLLDSSGYRNPIGAENADAYIHTSHYTELKTRTSIGAIQTWYVSAGAVGDAEWFVEYNLPTRGHNSFYVSGQFHLEFHERWTYDTDIVEIKLESRLDVDGTAISNGDTGLYGQAEFDWDASAQVWCYIAKGGTDVEPFPGGLPVLPNSPPKVANVTIDSTVSNVYGTNPPYSFQTKVGSGEQLRTIPVGGANRIAIQFTKAVDVSSNYLQLTALNRIIDVPDYTFIEPNAGNNFTATWTFDAPLSSSQYLLSLADSVTDLDGRSLDGEWVNPSSLTTGPGTTVFPSGDNVAGGSFEFVFSIMIGDFNLNSLWESPGGRGGYFPFGNNRTYQQGDLTGDGVVDLSDKLLFLQQPLYSDYRNLLTLGDFDGDYSVSSADAVIFEQYLNDVDSEEYWLADIDGDSEVTGADIDIFYERLALGIHLLTIE